MRILVCIPSKNRSENIKKFTLPFVQRLNLDYKIFIEPQDKEKYKYDNIIIHDSDNIGLGGALVNCKKYAEANNYDAILKIDDDVEAIGEIEKDLPLIIKAFSINQVSAICFPYDFEFYSKTDKMFTRENKRLQTAYFIKTDRFRPDKNISTFEDFYQFLQIINNNEKTLYCSKHLIKCKPVGKGTGGLQMFNREEMAKKEIQIFKNIDNTISIIKKIDKSWVYEPKFTDKKYKSKKI
jgi:GT2 family glycosyltransferase